MQSMLIRTLTGTFTLRRSRNNAADALQARVDDLQASDSGADSQATSAPEVTLKLTPIDPEVPRQRDRTGTERPARVTLTGRTLLAAMRLRRS